MEQNFSSANGEEFAIEKEIILTVYFTIRVAQSLFTLGGNILTIAAVRRFKALRTQTNIMVLSLTCADILTGILSPFNILGWRNIGGNGICLTETIISLQATGVSIVSIMLISIDRYLSVAKPLHYMTMMSRRKAWIAVIITWLAIFICVIMCTFLGGNWMDEVIQCTWAAVLSPIAYYGFLVPGFAISAVISLVLYLLIIHIARKRTRLRSLSTNTMDSYTNKKQTKISTMMGVIMVLYHALYLPATILEPFSFSGDLVVFSFYYFTRILWFSNAMINPLIYGWLNRDFRKAYQKLLHIKCHRSNQVFARPNTIT